VKLFICEIPFSYTEAEMKQLLSNYGNLVSFRLAVRRDSTSKGFGFCVYEDAATAEAACKALNMMPLGDRVLKVRYSDGISKSKYLQSPLGTPPQNSHGGLHPANGGNTGPPRLRRPTHISSAQPGTGVQSSHNSGGMREPGWGQHARHHARSQRAGSASSTDFHKYKSRDPERRKRNSPEAGVGGLTSNHNGIDTSRNPSDNVNKPQHIQDSRSSQVVVGDEPSVYLQLSGMCSREELIHLEEARDIVEDTRHECMRFGEVVGIYLPLPAGESPSSDPPGVTMVCAEYATIEAAVESQKSFHGRKFDSRSVTAKFLTKEEFEETFAVYYWEPLV